MKELDFKDRVAQHPGRIKLYPVEGQADTYIMERADEPIENGTLIDKVLFNSIVQSRLTGRFYPLAVTKSVASSTTYTGTPLPKTWTVESGGTTASNGNYLIGATSRIATGYEVDKAVDGDVNTAWAGESAATNYWLVKLPYSIAVTKVSFSLGLTTTSSSFKVEFQGSENGSTWKTLLTVNEAHSDVREYTLSNPGDYQWYRMYFTRGNGGRVYIMELSFNEYKINTYKNTITAEAMPGTWEVGQRITVQMPNISASTVSSNTFMGYTCNTILQPNKKYELRFNGASFDVKEI